MLKAIWYFIRYLLIGLGYLLSPLGWFYIICAVGAFLPKGKVQEYCLNQWYVLDVAVASQVFGTRRRTISGITGERAYEGKTSWKIMAKVIDTLAEWVGDKPEHCRRIYFWEIKNLPLNK